MLVKNGTIYWKASPHALPDEWQEYSLDQTKYGYIAYNPQRRLIFLLLALTLPLTILFLTEKGVKLIVLKFREKRKKKYQSVIADNKDPQNDNSEN